METSGLDSDTYRPPHDAEMTHGQGHSEMLGAVRALKPTDRAVLVVIEPDDAGGCNYVVESFGCEKEPHVVMGVLQAGITYAQYDLMDSWRSGGQEDEQPGDESGGDGEGS